MVHLQEGNLKNELALCDTHLSLLMDFIIQQVDQ